MLLVVPKEKLWTNPTRRSDTFASSEALLFRRATGNWRTNRRGTFCLKKSKSVSEKRKFLRKNSIGFSLHTLFQVEGASETRHSLQCTARVSDPLLGGGGGQRMMADDEMMSGFGVLSLMELWGGGWHSEVTYSLRSQSLLKLLCRREEEGRRNYFKIKPKKKKKKF